jgi:hypothetical protein
VRKQGHSLSGRQHRVWNHEGSPLNESTRRRAAHRRTADLARKLDKIAPQALPWWLRWTNPLTVALDKWRSRQHPQACRAGSAI